MEKSYDSCVKALNMAFDLFDRLDQWIAPSTQLLRDAKEEFPMLAAMSRDMSPESTSEGSIGMIAALAAGFQALSIEYDNVFEDSSPGHDELADVDELLVNEDDELRERVVRVIPRTEALFTGGLTDRQGGFLIGFCLLVNWVDQYVPEDLYTSSDKLGELLTDAEAPPSFDDEVARVTKEVEGNPQEITAGTVIDAFHKQRKASDPSLVDAYSAPTFQAAAGSSDLRDTLAKLLEITEDVHICTVGDAVLLMVRITDPEIAVLTQAASLVASVIPIKRQYVKSGSGLAEIQLVSELK